MKIWFSTYQLYPKTALNSRVKVKYRKGALLRIRFPDESVGYADLCPFSEMGDRPLDFELRHIALSKPTDLGARSLYYAQKDAEARKRGIRLYDSTIRIKNHFLIPDILGFDLERVAKIEADGYTEFKIKMGRDLVAETEKVEHLSNRISPGTRLRLDFNCSMNRERFVEWFEKNQKWLRSVLEFIEDPFTYESKDWREISNKYNITFALDRAADPIVTEAAGAGVIVIKPAVQDPEIIVQRFIDTDKKFVFTHHMDFPLGQMSAFYAAQSLFNGIQNQMLTCGLQHHDIYEGFTFQNAITADGPYILPPDGVGLGFDKLLESQTWTVLK